MCITYNWRNWRDLVKREIIDGVPHIEIDENQFDVYDVFPQENYDEFTVPYVKPYSDVSVVHLDIETTGLDSSKDAIVMIGLRNERGVNKILYNTELLSESLYQNEYWILKALNEILIKKKPEIILTYNGFNFDIPFIMERCRLYNLPSLFEYKTNEYGEIKTKIFRAAKRFNQSVTYSDIRCKIKGTGIIDLYHQVLRVDGVQGKLTKHTLKEVPLQWNLRSESRLDLSYPEMQECINNGDWQTLADYLVFDLEDTQLIADDVMPPIWLQTALFNWGIQSLATSGNAAKWNDLIARKYGAMPKPCQTSRYKGALTLAYTGLFKNAKKLDVGSLYPYTMLNYAIASKKDPSRYMLSILNSITRQRIELKGKPDKYSQDLQAFLKIFINSGYGTLGTANINYNDYEAAAMVTAVGRKIFMIIHDYIVDIDGSIITCDTDGICFSLDCDSDRITQEVNDILPENILVKQEFDNSAAVYVPPSDINQSDRTGKRKTYIIFSGDNYEKVKRVGLYKKRDKSQLVKNFHVDVCQIYLRSGEEAAIAHYQDLRSKISSGNIDLGIIAETRTLRSNEKQSYIDLGLDKSKKHTVTYVFGENIRISEKTGKLLKSSKKYIAVTENASYWVDYYLNILDDLWAEFSLAVNVT